MKFTDGDWNAPTRSQRNDMPENIFMGPNRTYPYKQKVNGKWVVNVNALRSIIRLANFHGQHDIANRASKMLREINNQKSD